MLRPPLRFVALGDSYTIGTGVEPEARWPDQLVARLAERRPEAPPLSLVGNLAANGRTSDDVRRVQLPRLWSLEPAFVSLLVGVNDVVQGVPLAVYRWNVAAVLDELLDRLPPGRLLAISTPDYTVTPAGADYGDPTVQAAAIRTFNVALAELAVARGIAIVDIHDLSLEAATERSLVAGDGLHPSAAQYAGWVDRIAPVVEACLEREPPA